LSSLKARLSSRYQVRINIGDWQRWLVTGVNNKAPLLPLKARLAGYHWWLPEGWLSRLVR